VTQSEWHHQIHFTLMPNVAEYVDKAFTGGVINVEVIFD
jgi:hypothetical protein